MRDAFGGAFMIKLFLVFILIYVCFTAVALNYAKAFKAKNLIVSYLEENEIQDINMTAVAENEMRAYFEKELVGNLNYAYPISCQGHDPRTTKCYSDYGVIIEQISPTTSNKNKLGNYYKVYTYFGFQLPFFDRL